MLHSITGQGHRTKSQECSPLSLPSHITEKMIPFWVYPWRLRAWPSPSLHLDSEYTRLGLDWWVSGCPRTLGRRQKLRRPQWAQVSSQLHASGLHPGVGRSFLSETARHEPGYMSTQTSEVSEQPCAHIRLWVSLRFVINSWGGMGVVCFVKDLGIKLKEIHHIVIPVILQDCSCWMLLPMAVELEPL